METLSLLGIHTDSEHLVLVDQLGERYLLPINEELRSIMRQQKRRLAEAMTKANGNNLRPKDIQTLIRSGLSAVEVATASGLDVDNVSRFEAPVLAERAYAAAQARDTALSAEKNAPTLGDLVIDRLATRGVSPESLVWDATRQPGENWMIHLEFVQDAQAMEANWEFNAESRMLLAQDEQSRWLTETTAPAGSSLHSGYSSRFDRGAATRLGTSQPSPSTAPESAHEPSSRTESLLDELNAARGSRLQVVLPEDDAEDDVAAMEAAIAQGFVEDSATAADSRETDSTHPAEVLPMSPRNKPEAETFPLPSAPPEPPETPQGTLPGLEELPVVPSSPGNETKPSRSRGRAPMPSWDEILFGSKDS